ncbi:lipocalin [Rhodophyticola sp. CCM32]|uniref:lipocalin family protein n=1 Tax=Rhodophyticola sp. CCM32 TaxID=2916397 RepID=UPI00107F180B|nr:lipocalin family protein [Rhodophyticola sp. CCM32]QBY01881.1 lipocalin [Rhodophyticola sp. CCM32]
MRPVCALFLLCAISACGLGGPGFRDPSVIIASNANFDPARYAGRWYEVARYPNAVQSGCAGAIADYQMQPDGSLAIRETCLDGTGAPLREIMGQATLSGPGRLSVRLAGVPGAAPYWVLWVDEGYRTAVLGQPDGRAGWILNRDPVIPADRLTAAREVLAFNGYDLTDLQPSGAMIPR